MKWHCLYIKEDSHERLWIYKKILAAMAKTRIEIFPDIYELLDFFEEVPEYDSEMYVHKKMKTTNGQAH